MQVQPYLNFDGRCEEALEFYKKALHAHVTMMMRFKESPEAHPPGMLPPGGENKIMHAAFKVGNSELFASDGHCTGHASFQGINLSLTIPSAPDAHRVFAALSEGGKVQMPLTKTFFSPAFGMVADRFGIMWMIMASPMNA